MVKTTIIRTIYVVAALAAFNLSTGAEPIGAVPGRILLKRSVGAPPHAVADAIRPYSGSETEEFPGVGIVAVQVPERAWVQALEGLKRNPHIEFAEPDVIHAPDATADDPYYAQAWHLPKIQAPAAWDTTFGSSSVIVAILDSGVDATHPDLSANIVSGWNSYSGNSDTSDVHGHGTAVAGTVAASVNNGVGVAGIAGKCRIMPMRITDAEGYGYDSAMVKALTWAADRGARVANISFEVNTSSSVRTAAQYFQNKGGVVTVSAGNYSTFESSPDNPYVITVSATDRYDQIATFSNTGNIVDVSAPGVGVMTTLRGGGYGGKSGTSFSAPVVAGVAALVISAQPNLTGAQVAQLLETTADDLGESGWDTTFGAGRVNAYRAIQSVAPSPPDTTAPQVVITSPANGQTVTGPVTVAVNATDNTGVARADLYVSGVLVNTSTTAPFSTTWNSSSAAPGNYSMQVKAHDSAGNVGISQLVIVTIASQTQGDTIRPTISIVTPTSGQTVSGGQNIVVSASDNIAVTRVNFYVDGKFSGYSERAPFTIAWDSTKVPAGNHKLQVRAFDAAGNVGISATIEVFVTSGPTDTVAPQVSITSPISGQTVGNPANVTVNATDNIRVVRVELYADGVLVNSSSTAPFTTTWNTSATPAGSHTLQVKAFDAAGNSAVSPSVLVSVGSSPTDVTRPEVSITSPTSGQTVSGTTYVYVNATDNIGVTRVNLYVDGKLTAYSVRSPFTLAWNTSLAVAGQHTIHVDAIDAANNRTVSAPVTVVK